ACTPTCRPAGPTRSVTAPPASATSAPSRYSLKQTAYSPGSQPMLEFPLVMLPLDGNLQSKLDLLTAQQYIQVPGTAPQVIYMLCRPASVDSLAQGLGFGKFGVDDSQVKILRDGKLINADGSEEAVQ